MSKSCTHIWDEPVKLNRYSTERYDTGKIRDGYCVMASREVIITSLVSYCKICKETKIIKEKI